MNIDETYSADYVDAQYRQWKTDPQSVADSWQFFFQGFELASNGGSTEVSRRPSSGTSSPKQAHVESLIYGYRNIGHLLACLDPLSACPTSHPLLDLAIFELSPEDLKDRFHVHIGDLEEASLAEIVEALKETYCRSIGIEYMHLQDPDERQWLIDRMEPNRNKPQLRNDEKLRILHKLSHATQFETLLNKRYPGQTRFSLEGAETLISTLDALVMQAVSQGSTDFLIGMSHRGRLNVLVNILQKPYLEIFQEFANSYDPDSMVGAGDVKYHNGYLSEILLPDREKIQILMVNNPSHLESVDPVLEGVARGLQDALPEVEKKNVVPILIHGDAAFSGQGVVTETLNLSQLDGYATKGTIHIVVNNQIGYTTLPEHARSTRYSTDVAKMLMVPIFHVHGENPEALAHVVKIANDYRRAFAKDVVIDLVCYRRHGHNEGDEPYFTQPQMYSRIKERPPVHKLYADQLLAENITTQQDVDQILLDTRQCLEDQFEAERKTERKLKKPRFYDNWKRYTTDYSAKSAKTGISKKQLLHLGEKLNVPPEGFKIHPKLARIYKARLHAIQKGEGIDWANAEALSFGSLLLEDIPIRLSGQDSARGTFSQRHAVIHDIETGRAYTPLSTLGQKQGIFEVYNSSLSETGVLGFDYGYSMVRPESLVIWEAQFGDFVNNAQSIIDLYIASGEAKWQRNSGLVMLLPHGMEGLGPEHSSARLERFLQLCSDNNLLVCHPTSPAQYFHLLRRQMKSRYRKPLIVMSPKSLLRNAAAVSSLKSLTTGSFETVMENPQAAGKCRRVLITAGKVYYELVQRREELNADDIAIVRIEQYYPFPADELETILDHYSEAREWYWVQEEPQNMGAFNFLRPRLGKLVGRHVRYIGRQPSATPATGFHNIYLQEREQLLTEAVGSLHQGEYETA